MMMMASGVCDTYRTMVLRNQGLLAMEGTASSIRGCILMKLSVSSGNSLDTLYLSIGGVPAQLPGLQMEWRKRKVMKRRDNGRGKKIVNRIWKKAQMKNHHFDRGRNETFFMVRASTEERKFNFLKINESAALND